MTRFLFLDEIYPDAWAEGPHSTLEEWFRWSFGTSNFWDIALRAAGHESETHVLNFDPYWQVKVAEYRPDVIVSQNLSVWGAYEGSPLSEMRRFSPNIKIVGMCSYRCDDYVKKGWDCIFSSFPWMVDHCKSLGVRCEYLPLAFGRPVLDRIGELPNERDIPVAFFGGLGSKIWDQGTKTMAAIAEAVPGLQWHGYAAGDLPMSLQMIRHPAKYGLDYYRLLARTKICLNRHGEIARGFGNNMRTFEAPGMGCWHLSDFEGEFQCATYTSPMDAAMTIEYMLGMEGQLEREARERQEFILNFHTYEARVPKFLEVIKSL